MSEKPQPKRQFLVTVDGDAAQDEKVAALIRGVLNGSVTVERLADKIGGFPAIWDADAPPGSVIVFQADKAEPTGHFTPPPPTGRNYGPTPEEWDRLRAHLEKGVSNPYGPFSVGTADGAVVGRFHTREEADKAAERWNQQDILKEMYPAAVRDLREETTHED